MARVYLFSEMSSVFEPNVDISAGLTFKPQTNGTVDLDTSRGSASLDQVQSVQNGTKSNFNHIIGLYEVMNDQGEENGYKFSFYHDPETLHDSVEKSNKEGETK